jgi:NADPH:quinone reductase-like Zn-dependent oxidoreductase
MNALIFRQAGEADEVLEYTVAARPAVRDGEVLVEVNRRPIHPADLAFIRGQYRVRPNFPQVAGLEGAGVIVNAPAGAPYAVGTRVAFRSPGSWADVASVPFGRLIAIPSGISDEAACQVSLNPVTAFGLLAEANVQPGDWILLTAAASTVSNMVASIARARGINVIGVVRGNAIEKKALSQAGQLFSTEDPELVTKIASIAGERRVSALIDSVGGPIVTKLFATLAPGAHIVAYGVQDREPAAVTNAMLIYSNLTWKGFGIDRWLSQRTADATVAMLDGLWSMIADESLALPVSSTHNLEHVQQALAADAERGRVGKVLLAS